MTRRTRTRHWFGIELSAYILLGACLLTVAWTNHYVSSPVVLVAWALAALVVTLSLRGIYRGR